jgi:hypothetical protein
MMDASELREYGDLRYHQGFEAGKTKGWDDKRMVEPTERGLVGLIAGLVTGMVLCVLIDLTAMLMVISKVLYG